MLLAALALAGVLVEARVAAGLLEVLALVATQKVPHVLAVVRSSNLLMVFVAAAWVDL